MTDTLLKTLTIKPIGNTELGVQTVQIEPATTCSDVITSLGFAPGDFSLSDPNSEEIVFQPGDDLYAKVEDGTTLRLGAAMTAGKAAAA